MKIEISLVRLAMVVFLIAPGTSMPAFAQTISPREANKVVMQAKEMAGNMTEEKAGKMMGMASFLNSKNYTYECREVCLLICRSRYANGDHYALLANTYLSGLGDENKARPAKQYLDKAQQLSPKSGYVHSVVTLMAMEEGRYQDAIAAADKAISCRQPVGHIYQLKASALANLGRDQEAVAVIEKAPMNVVCKDPAYWRIRGNILENLKRYNDAAECYRKALVLGETDVINFRLVKCLELQNKFAEAITEISKVIAKNPRDGDAYRVRAALKEKNNDLAGAIRDYDSCLALEPTVKSYKDRAKVHALMGHKDQAQKDLSEAKKLDDRI